jgi:hypothetical protein
MSSIDSILSIPHILPYIKAVFYAPANLAPDNSCFGIQIWFIVGVIKKPVESC